MGTVNHGNAMMQSGTSYSRLPNHQRSRRKDTLTNEKSRKYVILGVVNILHPNLNPWTYKRCLEPTLTSIHLPSTFSSWYRLQMPSRSLLSDTHGLGLRFFQVPRGSMRKVL